MSVKKYIKLALFTSSVNLLSIFNVIFALSTFVYLLLALFIVNNHKSNKRIFDKRIFAFIQLFMLIIFTFICTTYAITFIPVTQYVVQTYFLKWYYIHLLFSIVGLFSFYYLFYKLCRLTVQIIRAKEDADEN